MKQYFTKLIESYKIITVCSLAIMPLYLLVELLDKFGDLIDEFSTPMTIFSLFAISILFFMVLPLFALNFKSHPWLSNKEKKEKS